MRDIIIDIATANSRTSKTWKNKTTSWVWLVERCRETTRTAETMAEYLRESKEAQSRIKDVGGFVGGYLHGGQRKSNSVVHRSVVTLDIDHGTADIWDEFTMAYDCAAMLYSTHKHTPEAPRYRLVLPLSRNVTPEEYEPICRRIASDLGMDAFDDSTYQLARLFYWPSTSKDGEYIFECQEGEALDPDRILATYHNYKDASLWPTSSREGQAVRHEIKKAGDPTAKHGLIGAFCRAYSIEEAIEQLLPDHYEPTAQDGRYTYKHGSVAGGLVCYDGLFAYSHHETDPAGRQLCNAFDLCRLHLFGLSDEGSKVQDITRLPSYQQMQDYVASDPKVRTLLAKERLQSANSDFDGYEDDDSDTTTERPDGNAEDIDAWLAELEYDRKGNIKPTTANLIAIIENDRRLKGKLWHDEFSGFDMVQGGLPWDKTATQWGNRDDANLRCYIEANYGLSCRDKVKDAKDAVLTKYRKHPIKDYLNSLQWDGVPRLDTLIIDYIGAEDTPLYRAMTRKHFTAAVARVFRPGCKYDYCLILAGAEGIGKSTLFHTMGGEWFNDSVVTTEGKAGMEQLRCAWIVEMAELASIKRSEVEQVKGYISRREDIYRAAYGSVTERHPRQCVFCGTTNETHFLKGNTGNRRFWVLPVDSAYRCKEFKQVQADRDQLWAEAVHYFKQSEPLYLDTALEAEAKAKQAEYNDDADDPMPAMLEAFLEQRLPIDWHTWDLQRRRAYFRNPDPLDQEGTEERKEFAAAEFICERLGEDMGAKGYKYTARKVTEMMEKMPGWEKAHTVYHVQHIYGRQRGWRVTTRERLRRNSTSNTTF